MLIEKNNEGKNLNEEAIKKYFELLKHNLNKAKKIRGLSPEEVADLASITNYLENVPKLRKGDLELVLKIDVDMPEERVEEWVNYGDEKKFKEDASEIKKIADIINDLPDKTPFFAEVKTYLAGKTGVTPPPADNVDEQDKLNHYFTLSPEHFFGIYSVWKLKTDSAEKENTKKEMEKAKDSEGTLLSKTVYGDGKEYTDKGIIKYYAEKLGGVKHDFSKQKDKDDNGGKKPKSFWSWENPAAIISGVCLGAAALIIIAGIVYWDKLAAWWDGPANAEGNGDLDEADDE